jgi:uncharacterized membrane protein
MSNGFLLTILTGLSWAIIGVVLSRCAKDRFDVISYSITQTLVTAVLSFVIYANITALTSSNHMVLIMLVFSAGLLNAIAQMIVKIAMGRGNHGPVWAISQSALIIPFLFGSFFMGNHGSLGQWFGTVMIIGGIMIPVMGKFGDFRHWLLPAIAAFFLFGIVQTLYAIPSQLHDFHDTTGMRPMLAALGGLTGWELIRRQQRKKVTWDKRAVGLAICMAILSVASLKIFFSGMDQLSDAGLGNIGIPLIVGSNIIGFSIYSFVILKERTNRIEAIGMLVVLSGIIMLAI